MRSDRKPVVQKSIYPGDMNRVRLELLLDLVEGHDHAQVFLEHPVERFGFRRVQEVELLRLRLNLRPLLLHSLPVNDDIRFPKAWLGRLGRFSVFLGMDNT